MRSLTLPFLCLLAATCMAQDQISGVVNQYAAVERVGVVGCRTSVTVDNPTPFRTGDRVLLIQMKGASVSTRDETFGEVVDYGSAGCFDLATVEAVNGKDVLLAGALAHTYDVRHSVQLVRISYHTRARITSNITAPPWDGRIGGVIAIEVNKDLTFAANISADELGFAGATFVNGRSSCSVLNFYGPVNDRDLQPRGEGIAAPPAGAEWGRTPMANGGGGGNAHNAGGGGGGNGGLGGVGGNQWTGCNPPTANGGMGGRAIKFNTGDARVFLGGGGGAGHGNDRVGTSGVRGGGIVFIKADTLIGGTHLISADGASVTALAGNDGAGGGGAGGTVLFDVNTLVNWQLMRVTCHGGSGGSLRQGANHGPGGGGGGGAVLFANFAAVPAPATNITVSGGIHGINQLMGTPTLAAHGSLDGDDGVVLAGMNIWQGAEVGGPIVTAPQDFQLCADSLVELVAQVSNGVQPLVIQWTDSGGALLGSSASVLVTLAQAPYVIITVTDANGCRVADTVRITRKSPANIELVLPFQAEPSLCTAFVDTLVTVVNRGAESTQVMLTTSGSVSLIDPPSFLVPAGASVWRRIRVARGAGDVGLGTVVAVAQPCSTVTSKTVQWMFGGLDVAFEPDVLIISSESCVVTSRDTTATLHVRTKHNVSVVGWMTIGAVSLTSALPPSVAGGDSLEIGVRFAPTPQYDYGRLGVIVKYLDCIDTVWCRFEGRAGKAVVTSPQSVLLPSAAGCAGTPPSATFDLVDVTASTEWTVSSVVVTGPIIVDLQAGDTFTGSRTVVVQGTPTADGPYTGEVTIRLLPCDTIIVISVQGNRLTQQVLSTPLLVYQDVMIGARSVLRAIYRNIGTAPVRIVTAAITNGPFTLVRTGPPLPALLAPGDELYADVELLQRAGTHVDTLALEIDSACPITVQTQLRAAATASTTVRLPTLTAEVGATVMLPVTIEEMPLVDTALLTMFTFQFTAPIQQLGITPGTDGNTSWTTSTTNSLLTVSVEGSWNGTDTLARIPALVALAPESTIPLMFDRDLPFAWKDVATNVTQIDGEITVLDVCSGRTTRSIVQGGAIQRVQVSPLPAMDRVVVAADLSLPEYLTVSVVDVSGVRVSETMADATEHHQIAIPLTTIPIGAYVVIASTRFEQVHIPLIIVR